MRRTNLFNFILKMLILGLVLFALLRIAFIIRFGELGTLLNSPKSLPLLIYNAFRFDAQVIAYLMIPIVIWFLANVFTPKEKFIKASLTFFQYYFPSVFTLIAIVSLLDQQFYINFGSHFNPVFFDFFNEEPAILIKSIWKEHPVIWITLGCIAFFWLMQITIKVIIKNEKATIITSGVYAKSLPIICLILLPIGIRGSVSTFMLRAEDVYISDNNKINDYVPNAVFMLKKAYSEHKQQFKIETPQEILIQHGFKTIHEAIACYFDVTPDSAAKKEIEDWIFSSTPQSNPTSQPNVVVILTESWSNRLIDFQSDSMNLLCSMKQHLQQDILFRNFQSSTNGTINAIESLVIGTPYQPLFTSKYRYLSYPTSMAAPFKANHYTTSFISGIELSWRNLEEVLPNQQFDQVMGKYELLKENPTAECNHTWGIYDHEMLNFVADKLEHQNKPNFMLCLTSSSHTPFEFPDDYDLPELNLSNKTMENFKGDPSLVKEYLKGYQYSNRALGDFMTRIKSNPALASNTIVVITGDHNIRMILPYRNAQEQRIEHSVPLYIYLPPQMRQMVQADTSRWGSHSDIIPTLVPMLFSNTHYVNMGQNLFDNSQDPQLSVSINVSQVQHGSALTDEEAKQKAAARETILKFYFQKIFSANEKSLLQVTK